MMAWTLVSTLLAQDPNALGTAPAFEVRERVSAALVRELEADAERLESAHLPELRSALEDAARELGPASRIGQALAEASARAAAPTDVARTLEDLSAFVRERALDLVFAPRIEAARPAGFPAATPVGEIAVLDYPAYRLARTALPRGRNGAFWKLFQHIEENEIAMTAPVEMTYERDGAGERMHSMAFLYATQEIGQLGEQDGVEVVDVPAARVLSLGLRGRSDDARFVRALVELRGWLARNAAWEECGPARVLGWNSPMVPAERSYSEVQIPIRAQSRAGAPQAERASRPR